MSNQYPGQPGQPGDLPPTQVAPGNVPPPQQPGAPQGYPQGYPQQPPAPYGAPGGGGFPPPPQFGAPPTGGGGGKKIALILAIVGVLVLLVVGGAVAAFVLLGDDDDDGDDAKDPVTITSTLDTSVPTDTTPPTTGVTTSTPTEDTSSPPTTGGPSAEDAEITAAAYLNSLLEGNCLAVEGLSTPEWFSSAYGNQRGCKRASGNQEMATAQYENFQASVDNGDGSIILVATVTDSSDATGTEYTATWILVPDDDNSDWLVNGFQLV